MADVSPWQDVRGRQRDLGFLLLFVPAKTRDLCADIVLLGFELDNAIHIPSEIMLAAIRLQWWRDALSSESPSHVPLVQRLQSHIDAGRVARASVLALIDSWQDRLGDNDLNPYHCWGAGWALLGVILMGTPEDSDRLAAQKTSAATIGRQCMALMMAPEGRVQTVTSQPHGNEPVDGLPPLFRVMAGLTAYWRRNPTADSDDPLMIWRMLGWRYGIGRKS